MNRVPMAHRHTARHGEDGARHPPRMGGWLWRRRHASLANSLRFSSDLLKDYRCSPKPSLCNPATMPAATKRRPCRPGSPRAWHSISRSGWASSGAETTCCTGSRPDPTRCT
ncbi:hypothetical protein CBM2633_B60028 [Cupriavidus taiwanensis]|nr:hypothetical protein CBM2633_B60028 [Cupriavidus taiwanensis]